MSNLDDEIYVKLEYSRQENQSRNFRLDVELHLPGKGNYCGVWGNLALAKRLSCVVLRVLKKVPLESSK